MKCFRPSKDLNVRKSENTGLRPRRPKGKSVKISKVPRCQMRLLQIKQDPLNPKNTAERVFPRRKLGFFWRLTRRFRYAPYGPNAKRVRLLYTGQVVKAGGPPRWCRGRNLKRLTTMCGGGVECFGLKCTKQNQNLLLFLWEKLKNMNDVFGVCHLETMFNAAKRCEAMRETDVA